MKNNSYSKYLNVCSEAVQDEKAFETFKAHPDYIRVVEACGRSHGVSYLSVIRRQYPHLMDYLPLFSVSDTVGSPKRYYYRGAHRSFSATTLRYVKVLGDLESLFGSLSDMDIVEIGGGYGGQCKIIYDIMKPRSYTIVDLPEALAVAGKYLKHFGIDDVILSPPKTNFKSSYDLCISNYAFSEIDFNYQRRYADKIIKYCDRGYMICNHFTRPKTSQMYNLDIFKIRGGNFSPETPLTGVDNILFTWNHIKSI